MDGLETIFGTLGFFAILFIILCIALFLLGVAVFGGAVALIVIGIRKMKNPKSQKEKTIWTILFVIGCIITVPLALILIKCGLELFAGLFLIT